MNLQPEKLSPDIAAIANVIFKANGSSTRFAPTSIPVAHQQGWYIQLPCALFLDIDYLPGSLFLRLPLELRSMIYDNALDYESDLPLGHLPIDYPEVLRAMVQLAGVSCQIRYEAHAWIPDHVCVIHLSMTRGRCLRPLSTSSKYPTAFLKGPDEWKDFYLGAPRGFKFWKSSMFVFTWSSGLIAFEIDFRTREVFVEGRRVDMNRYGPYQSSVYGPSESWVKEAEKLSPEALQASENSLTRSMQTVVDQEGFDGLTLEDVHLLLRNLKVSVPEISGDVHLEFEDSEVKSVETGGE